MRSAWLALVLFLSLLLAGCDGPLPASEGMMRFSSCHVSDCDEEFIDVISGAKTLSCAFYEIDDERMVNLLRSLHADVIIDEHVRDDYGFRVRRGEGLMHDKFCVINRSVVITGSFNPGSQETYDNVVVMRSPPIAHHYEEAFDQILKRNKHPSKHELFLHNGILIEAYTCPQDGCARRVHEIVAHANRSVHLALFTFTDRELTELLIGDMKRGVKVTGVIESFQSHAYNQYYPLREAGADVILEGTPRLQHNKVIVIDGSIVITGSFNPTRSADTVNDENILIIHDEAVASHYVSLVEDVIKRTQSFK